MTDLRKIIKDLRFRSGKLNETLRGREKDYHYALTKATANQALEDAEILERFVQELQKEVDDDTKMQDSLLPDFRDWTNVNVLQRVIGVEAKPE